MGKPTEPKNFTTANRLCLCLSLKTGLSILAWIELVLAVVAVLVGIAQIILLSISSDYDYLNIDVKDLGTISEFCDFRN